VHPQFLEPHFKEPSEFYELCSENITLIPLNVIIVTYALCFPHGNNKGVFSFPHLVKFHQHQGICNAQKFAVGKRSERKRVWRDAIDNSSSLRDGQKVGLEFNKKEFCHQINNYKLLQTDHTPCSKWQVEQW